MIRQAQALTGLRTKRAVVEGALRRLVRLRQQEAVRRLRGKVTRTADLEGNAGGEITACETPRRFALTWEWQGT